MEITANRPDGHSVIGVAREVAAAFHKPFQGHEPKVRAGAGNIEELVNARVESPDLCPRYTVRAVKTSRLGPPPNGCASASAPAACAPSTTSSTSQTMS